MHDDTVSDLLAYQKRARNVKALEELELPPIMIRI